MLTLLGDLKQMLTNKIALMPTNVLGDTAAIFYMWTYEIAAGVEYLHSKKVCVWER